MSVASPCILQARKLFCERDERVLFRDLDFDLHAGELMQVQGSNGSGKTTLLRMICGLNTDYEGDILLHGKPVQENRELFLTSLLYMGHRVGVNRVLSPRENLAWSSALQGAPTGEQIDAALIEVGLAGFEDSACHSLSAGQQQRVSLARLLLSPANLWILDEPFTTLDVYGVKYLENLLARHVTGGGAALVTTHHKLDVPCDITRLSLDGIGAVAA
jgi:heme exporter protein A